ncbi:MAG: hypothetical protein U9R08_02935 [Nanoarchaeota archaeon]|nr:hypothetical protein [Nanoarchaeota archaeon]
MIINPVGGLNQRELLNPLNNHVMNSGGLAIKTGSSALVKTANDVYYTYDGVLYELAACDMAALTSGGVLSDGYKNVVVFTVDVDGNKSAHFGTAATTIAGITWPTAPSADDEAVIGWLLIENGSGSDFTFGTTALDTGSVTCNYFNATFACWPFS